MEYQLSGFIGAEAVVAIEKGDGDASPGTMVKYFFAGLTLIFGSANWRNRSPVRFQFLFR